MIKFVYLLIYGRVSAPFEDDEFSPTNVGLHPIGKVGDQRLSGSLLIVIHGDIVHLTLRIF